MAFIRSGPLTLREEGVGSLSGELGGDQGKGAPLFKGMGRPGGKAKGKGKERAEAKFLDPLIHTAGHNWDVSFVHSRPIGHEDDPGSWDVHPAARQLHAAYVVMAQKLGFDTEVNHLFCELNSVNANVFVNCYRNHSDDWDTHSKCATGYLTRGLLRNNSDNDDPAYNPGLKWWKDPACARDVELRHAFFNPGIKKEDPSGERGRPVEMGGAGGSGIRTRSPRRLSEGDLLRLIDQARHDYTVGRNMDERTYVDLMGVSCRLHTIPGGFREPQTYHRRGAAPRYHDFRTGTTYLNVAKLMYLEYLNPGFHGIWSVTLQGRFARTSVNGMAGTELGDLIEQAKEGWILGEKEAARFRDRYIRHPGRVRLAICKYFMDNNCRDGEYCDYLHAEQEREMEGDVVFSGFHG